jgi:hypothetical protein
VEGQYCAHCGSPTGTPGTPAPATAPVHHTPTHVPPGAHPLPSQGLAVAALILNILIWPGLGSLIAGEQVGWAQGFLFLLGVILAFVLIGIPIMIAVWVWGIVTGVQLVQRASPPPGATA